jgi:hypothetical protein
MKKVLVAAALVLASLSAHALDGQLILSNRGTGLDKPVKFLDGPKAGGNVDGAYQLQLFRVNGGSETAVGSAVTFRTGNGAGYFPNTTFTIPNFGDASGTAQFLVKAFDLGMNFDTATTYRGASSVFDATVNVAPTPPVATSNFPTFGLTQVPEPSTIALAVLGGAALLFRRRK